MVLSCALAAGATIASSGEPAAAQAATYNCDDGSDTYPAEVGGTVGTAPESIAVGDTAHLSEIAITFTPDASQWLGEDLTLSAVLSPSGSAQAGSTRADDQVAFTGGTGSVAATGTPGTTMAVTLDSATVTNPTSGFTATCTPGGAPLVLREIHLSEHGTPPGPPVPAPPTPIPSSPTYAG